MLLFTAPFLSFLKGQGENPGFFENVPLNPGMFKPEKLFFSISSVLLGYPMYVSINLAFGDGDRVTTSVSAGIKTVCP